MITLGICPYCGESAGKNELGYAQLMHHNHRAGTPFWARWYRKERDAGRRQTEIGDALLLMCEERAQGAAAGLAKMHAIQKEKEPATDRPKGVNPGLLRMQELNRQRAAERKAAK